MPGVEQLLRDGIVAAQSRQFERARPLLERVTAELPADAVGWFWRAVVSPSPEDAIASLRRVLEIDGEHGAARRSLTQLLLADAHRVAASGRRNDARALAVEATRLTPQAPAAWLALAALTLDPLERVDALRRAIALSPEEPHLKTRLRQALLVRGVNASTERVEARACFREALDLDPNDARLWLILAKLADSPAEAADALHEVLRLAPTHAVGRAALRDALVADAAELANAERIDESCERWREAIALIGGDVETWLGLAATTPDQAEAGRAIEAAYAQSPDNPRAAAAMERLHSRIDPQQAVPPADAFARFDVDGGAVSLEAIDGDDPLASLDSLLDAFATPQPRAAAAPAHVPTAAAVEAMPAAPRPAVAVPAAPVSPAPVSTAAASSRRTVMVVDDSPTIRKILGLTLERAGYDVLAEPDGESALARLAQTKPDLVLLDIAMPNLDGYEVCKQIKQNPQTASVPVVMLSGKGALFDKVKGHMAGAAEYLTKPFETPAVLAVVTNYCDRAVETVNG